MSQVQIRKGHSGASSLYSFRQRHYSEISGRSGLTTLSEDTISINEEETQEEEEKIDDVFFQHNLGWNFFLYLPFDPVWEVFIIFVIITDLVGLTVVDTNPAASGKQDDDVYGVYLIVAVTNHLNISCFFLL